MLHVTVRWSPSPLRPSPTMAHPPSFLLPPQSPRSHSSNNMHTSSPGICSFAITYRLNFINHKPIIFLTIPSCTTQVVLQPFAQQSSEPSPDKTPTPSPSPSEPPQQPETPSSAARVSPSVSPPPTPSGTAPTPAEAVPGGDSPGNSGGSGPPGRGGAGAGAGDGGSGGSDPSDSESSSNDPEQSPVPIVPTPVDSQTDTSPTSSNPIITKVDSVTSTLSNGFNYILTTVPAPVLVAVISFISTMTAARYKVSYDSRAADATREEDARKHKEEVERALRHSYNIYAGPLMKSTAKLAERLRFLVDGKWNTVEAVHVEGSLSPAYSAYLLGRFLAHVDILKCERSNLDFGFPTADRVLVNILARIQGTLCADDSVLKQVQRTETFFKPPPGAVPLDAGPLKLTPRAQTVLGELLLRRRWVGRVEYVGDDSKLSNPRSVLSFLEFSRLLAENDDMKRWYMPIVKDFSLIENCTRSTPHGPARRNNVVGARIYILQSALNDLMGFFDPLPHPASIPIFQRIRLRLGDRAYAEERRSPMSLRLIYQELARFRDQRQLCTGASKRLQVPHEVEVFVTGTWNPGDQQMETAEHGNCINSHRVLIVLKEMGISHKTIPISLDSKPAWFYLLQPHCDTPVIYHDGNVVSNTTIIVGYLIDRFPKARRLASADHLRLAVGTAAFTRFHPHFVKWLSGDEKAKVRMEEELNKLEMTLREAQSKNGGRPFLGGARFSREDTAIAPCLHNVEIAARRLKKWSLPEDMAAVRKYLHAARKRNSFADSGVTEEAVVSRFNYIKGLKKIDDAIWSEWPLAALPE